MFTGLVERQSRVLSHEVGDKASRLVIQSPFDDVQTGESIAINGVCLTRLPEEALGLAFDVSPETHRLTTLGELRSGDYVNIERAMLATARFGGHYVSGHVDTTACVHAVRVIDAYHEVTIGTFASSEKLYLLPKGSITLNGVSLTINAVDDGCIQVMLVPHTLAVTTLGCLVEGQRLNVEFDYLTRIVAHQIKSMSAPSLPME